jgi:hypothetical protein
VLAPLPTLASIRRDESMCTEGVVPAAKIRTMRPMLTEFASAFEAGSSSSCRAAAAEGTFEIARSLPHGHVAAVLGTARALGLE